MLYIEQVKKSSNQHQFAPVKPPSSVIGHSSSNLAVRMTADRLIKKAIKIKAAGPLDIEMDRMGTDGMEVGKKRRSSVSSTSSGGSSVGRGRKKSIEEVKTMADERVQRGSTFANFETLKSQETRNGSIFTKTMSKINGDHFLSITR